MGGGGARFSLGSLLSRWSPFCLSAPHPTRLTRFDSASPALSLSLSVSLSFHLSAPPALFPSLSLSHHNRRISFNKNKQKPKNSRLSLNPSSSFRPPPPSPSRPPSLPPPPPPALYSCTTAPRPPTTRTTDGYTSASGTIAARCGRITSS